LNLKYTYATLEKVDDGRIMNMKLRCLPGGCLLCWKEFLLNHSKEELAELILDRMIRDRNFSREMYCKLSKQGEDKDVVIDS
jgi:hypothetical protein